jgi:F-type H+-transporting ATPase subunit b
MKRMVALLMVLGMLSLPTLALAAEAAAGAERELSPIPSVKEALIPAITTLIVFSLLLALLGAKAWKPIASGLKAREDRIRQDIEDAERGRIAAEQRLKEYEARLATAEDQVRQILAKAQGDAETMATNIKMRAQQEAEEIKERATRDIETARKAAVAEVYEQAANVSTSIAAKILQRNINADDQRQLVRSSLEQLESANVG